jgi:hypothetical protein
MCCLFTALVFLGPRFGIVIWALLEPARWQAAFDSFVWPLLGFIFVPWMTLSYAFVAVGGIEGGDWLIVGLGLLLDIFSWAGGGYGNRARMQSYYNYQE